MLKVSDRAAGHAGVALRRGEQAGVAGRDAWGTDWGCVKAWRTGCGVQRSVGDGLGVHEGMVDRLGGGAGRRGAQVMGWCRGGVRNRQGCVKAWGTGWAGEHGGVGDSRPGVHEKIEDRVGVQGFIRGVKARSRCRRRGDRLLGVHGGIRTGWGCMKAWGTGWGPVQAGRRGDRVGGARGGVGDRLGVAAGRGRQAGVAGRRGEQARGCREAWGTKVDTLLAGGAWAGRADCLLVRTDRLRGAGRCRWGDRPLGLRGGVEDTDAGVQEVMGDGQAGGAGRGTPSHVPPAAYHSVCICVCM